MARNRPYSSKIRYARALRKNRRIPLWVYMKTNRGVRLRPVRSWRRSRLQL